LRVTEAVNLKISQLYLDVGFIRVIGKGDKERLVPIGKEAIKYIKIYKDKIRTHVAVKPADEDILFLNKRGSKLSRVMIFLIVKELAKKPGSAETFHPIPFDTVLPLTWWKEAPICVPYRKCWVMKVSLPQKYTRTWIGSI
jgi:integrase/recombinase XerD